MNKLIFNGTSYEVIGEVEYMITSAHGEHYRMPVISDTGRAGFLVYEVIHPIDEENVCDWENPNDFIER